LWAGLFHVFFPHVAAASIGWEVSPFQFEVGVADIAIGLTAIASFWLFYAIQGGGDCLRNVVLCWSGDRPRSGSWHFGKFF
jgi:hypothetical protein